MSEFNIGSAIILVTCFCAISGTELSNSCSNCLSSPNNNTDTCDVISGKCLHGCILGFFGLNCSTVCPESCRRPVDNDNSTCDFTNGECVHGCEHGYAGPNCSITCPDNCAISEDTDTDVCNATSLQCLNACKKSFYGIKCDQRCSSFDENCEDCYTEDDNNSIVCSRCYKNFYRHNGKCKSCSYWCKSNINSPLPTCREHNGYCEFGCRLGYYGFLCGSHCSKTCRGACDRESGTCLTECKYPSYCGPTCELICSNTCLSQQCNQSCTCLHGCDPRYWGEQCQNLCNTNCKTPEDARNNFCNRDNGACLYGCSGSNFWGDQCQQRCPHGCVNGTCEQKSGNCIGGCTRLHVYGASCDLSCSANCSNGTCLRNGHCDEGCVVARYGDTCDHACPTNCYKQICDRVDGYCSEGCDAGWYGNTCSLQCIRTCFNYTCSQIEGVCLYGCVVGYKGSYCEVNEVPTQGDEINYYMLLGVSGSGWLSFIVILVALLCVLLRRHRASKEIKGSEEEGCEKENASSRKRDQHEYVTLNYNQGQSSTGNETYYENVKSEGGSSNTKQKKRRVSYVNLGLRRIF